MVDRVDDDLETAFLSEFECPVCCKYIFPPIRQCLTGHCFCNYCFDNIRRCAICRAPKSEARCFVLEKMHGLLSFPCKYQEEGCDFKGKGEQIKIHQNMCKFSAITCPLRFNSCQWRGNKAELMVHCMEDHPQNFYFNSRQKMVSSRFANLRDRHYFILFSVFNNIFRCSWDLNSETGLMRYAVYCLEKPVPCNRFSFEFAILLKNTLVEIVSLKGPCAAMDDDSERFINGKYLVANFDMIKEFCDDNGDLNYLVKIIKNDV